MTDRGRPVAQLVPVPPDDPLEALIRSGGVTRGRGRLSDLGMPPPAPPGAPLASEVLEQLRADER